MTSDTPRCEIAVIVPVHNAETFLPDCLNALADQRFNDFRCIWWTTAPRFFPVPLRRHGPQTIPVFS